MIAADLLLLMRYFVFCAWELHVRASYIKTKELYMGHKMLRLKKENVLLNFQTKLEYHSLGWISTVA